MAHRHPVVLALLALATAAVATAALATVAFAGASAAAAPPPNVVFILADDLGWRDVGFMGAEDIATPHLDRLATEGMVFTQAYSAGPNCAPSRAALLTGLYAPRTGVYTVGSSSRGRPEDRRLEPVPNTRVLAPEHETIAEVLARAGYASASIGKWHQGTDPEAGPRAQGFDHNVAGAQAGHPRSYHSPYGMAELEDGPEGEHLTSRLTDEAIRWLEQQQVAEQPFFLYLPYYAVHTPLEPEAEREAARSAARPDEPERRRKYAALVEGMDANIGRLLAALDRLGLRDSTLVVFTSDNGGVGGITSMAPLRGAKGMLYEGGIRVPTVVRWPGVVAPGSSCDEPMIGVDWLPTFADACGAEMPSRAPDGQSVLPLLRGEAMDRGPLYWHFPAYLEGGRNRPWRTTPVGVVRDGDWKLLEYFEDRRIELYNLAEDIGEAHDLADDEPQRAAALAEDLASWRRAVDAPMPTAIADLPPDAATGRGPIGMPAGVPASGPSPVRAALTPQDAAPPPRPEDVVVAPRPDRVLFDWNGHRDPAWVGPALWANRLQDWRVRDDRLELAHARPTPFRTVHALTAQVVDAKAPAQLSVRTGFLELPPGAVEDDSSRAVGVLLGVGHGRMDARGAAIVHQVTGVGTGVLCGVDDEGAIFVEDTEIGERAARAVFAAGALPEEMHISVALLPQPDGRVRVMCAVRSSAGAGSVQLDLPAERVLGNVALACNPGKPATRAWFDDFALTGPAFAFDPEAVLGPVLSAQHTLSRGVLRMTAQLMPVAEGSTDAVRLEVDRGGAWTTVAQSSVVRPGYTAHFRVPRWDASRDQAYRIVARHAGVDHAYAGTIRHDPVEQEELVLAALSCNHNNSHNLVGGWGSSGPGGRGDWTTLLWFPHQDLVDRVAAHDPDLLYFAGDQVYEGASPSPADRAHLEEDYLYKWYLWCWAYRDLTRDRPVVVIPDDHDVYQGNLWGAGGRKAPGRDNTGGYVHPARFVQMVERTQTSHLPDPFDPTPVEQEIGVYYTDLVYGRISFAILEDRKFKSGCADAALPPTNTGRPDHFNDPAFDTSRLDLPKFTLLGARQLAFLDHWAQDWRGCDMKAALSQTPFANLATHHGRDLSYLIADLDSNGWPQAGRLRALERLRACRAVHVSGDQHLSTLAQHGLEAHRDGPWSFCMPAAANFYPRQWLPPRAGDNRAPGAPAWTGDHLDGFGNRVTMHAATNPRKTGRKPADLHDGMAGYGIVRFDRGADTVTFECWTRDGDPAAGVGQYEGWPVTIATADNDGRIPEGMLPEVTAPEGVERPAVAVIDESSGRLVWSGRVPGPTVRAPVFAPGSYTVRIGDPDRDTWTVRTGLQPR